MYIIEKYPKYEYAYYAHLREILEVLTSRYNVMLLQQTVKLSDMLLHDNCDFQLM